MKSPKTQSASEGHRRHEHVKGPEDQGEVIHEDSERDLERGSEFRW